MSQAFQFCLKCLTMEGGTVVLSWYVSKQLPKYCVTSQKSGGVILLLNLPPVFTKAKHIFRSYMRQPRQNEQYINIVHFVGVVLRNCQLLHGRRWHRMAPNLIKKVKESRNRPGMAQRVPGALGSQISWHSAREGGEIRLTHRPPLPPGIFLVLIFTKGWVEPRAMVRSEGNMSLKNPVTPPGIDPGTVRLVAQRLNHYAIPGPPNLISQIYS